MGKINIFTLYLDIFLPFFDYFDLRSAFKYRLYDQRVEMFTGRGLGSVELDNVSHQIGVTFLEILYNKQLLNYSIEGYKRK